MISRIGAIEAAVTISPISALRLSTSLKTGTTTDIDGNESAPGKRGGTSSPNRDSISTNAFERLWVEIRVDRGSPPVDGVCFVAAVSGFDRLYMPTLGFQLCL